MPVFRVEKNTNYTTMCNYHLRDRNLTLKAKGLLSVFLSLPDNWDYSIAGLARPEPDGGYEIISGHRRCHAAELVGLKTLPVIVREMHSSYVVTDPKGYNIARQRK